MLTIASENGLEGIRAGWHVLSRGGSSLDAVEAAARVVEADPSDHTVGYGGYPNVLGEVELDASIMDDTTRRAGAVCALKGFRHAITVARGVMEKLPHVLLAGDGAARFAPELGMEPEDLLADEARETWKQVLEGKAVPGSLAAMMLSRYASLTTDPDHVAGTVNFIARDASGALAIQSGAALRIVQAMRRGAPVGTACAEAMHDLVGRGVPAAQASMRVVAVDGRKRGSSDDARGRRTEGDRTRDARRLERAPAQCARRGRGRTSTRCSSPGSRRWVSRSCRARRPRG